MANHRACFATQKEVPVSQTETERHLHPRIAVRIFNVVVAPEHIQLVAAIQPAIPRVFSAKHARDTAPTAAASAAAAAAAAGDAAAGAGAAAAAGDAAARAGAAACRVAHRL